MLAAAAQANPSPISQTALARLSHLQSPYTTLLAPVNIPPLSPTHFYVSLSSPITHIETSTRQITDQKYKHYLSAEAHQTTIAFESQISQQDEMETHHQDTHEDIPFFLKHAPPSTVQILQMYTNLNKNVNHL